MSEHPMYTYMIDHPVIYSVCMFLLGALVFYCLWDTHKAIEQELNMERIARELREGFNANVHQSRRSENDDFDHPGADAGQSGQSSVDSEHTGSDAPISQKT
jgi:hypothetical protein